MNFEPTGPLRTSTSLAERGLGTVGSDAAGAGWPGEDFATIADLVADLVETTKIVPPDRLAAARGRAGLVGLAQALQDEGLVDLTGVARSLARRFGLPFHDLAEERASPSAAELIPLKTLQRVVAVPVSRTDDRLVVAIADPANIHGIDELRLASRDTVDIVVAGREDILIELERLARQSEAMETQSALDDVEVLEDEDDLEVDDGVSDAPLVRLVNSIVMQAAADGASDIHFEPQDDSLLVRVRVDGVLSETQRIPKRMANGVTTRLKVLAKLDIAERRKPQDGRIALNARTVGRTLDVRVAVLPTVEGEQVVMRLIDKSRKAPSLESLGMSDSMREKLATIIRRPTGALLVTGPTGSGKSTTLYAALAEINKPEINIITVEDPVEYRLAGINQVQINVKADMTFASALRSDSPLGPRRDHGRRDQRCRDGEDGHRIGPHGPHGVLDAPHERRGGCDDAPERDGRRALPDGLCRLRRPRTTPCAQALHELLRDVLTDARGAHRGPDLARPGRGARRHGALPQGGVPTVRPDRVQGADRRVPAAHHERRARIARRAERPPGRDRACSRRGWNAVALGRRDRKGCCGAHLARGAHADHHECLTRAGSPGAGERT